MRRGEILLNFDLADSRDNELEEMNKIRKVANLHMQIHVSYFLVIWAYLSLSYRKTEVVVREHANTLQSVHDYSRIYRTINKLNIIISDD